MKSRITKKIPVDCAGRKSWKQLFFELKDNESILLTFADGARFSQGIHKYSDKHRIVLKEVKCICEKLRRCTKVKI